MAKVFAIILADARTSSVIASDMERSLYDIEKGILSINSALHEFSKYCPLAGNDSFGLCDLSGTNIGCIGCLAAKCDSIMNMGEM